MTEQKMSESMLRFKEYALARLHMNSDLSNKTSLREIFVKANQRGVGLWQDSKLMRIYSDINHNEWLAHDGFMGWIVPTKGGPYSAYARSLGQFNRLEKLSNIQAFHRLFDKQYLELLSDYDKVRSYVGGMNDLYAAIVSTPDNKDEYSQLLAQAKLFTSYISTFSKRFSPMGHRVIIKEAVSGRISPTLLAKLSELTLSDVKELVSFEGGERVAPLTSHIVDALRAGLISDSEAYDLILNVCEASDLANFISDYSLDAALSEINDEAVFKLIFVDVARGILKSDGVEFNPFVASYAACHAQGLYRPVDNIEVDSQLAAIAEEINTLLEQSDLAYVVGLDHLLSRKCFSDSCFLVEKFAAHKASGYLKIAREVTKGLTFKSEKYPFFTPESAKAFIGQHPIQLSIEIGRNLLEGRDSKFPVLLKTNPGVYEFVGAYVNGSDWSPEQKLGLIKSFRNQEDRLKMINALNLPRSLIGRLSALDRKRVFESDFGL